MKILLFLILFATFTSTPSFAEKKSDPHVAFTEALLAAQSNNLEAFYSSIGEYNYVFQGRDGNSTRGHTRMAKELAFEWMDYLSQKMVYGKSLSLGPTRNTRANCHVSYWLMENDKQSPVSIEFICRKLIPTNDLGDCKIIRFTKSRSPIPDNVICHQE